jgi:septin family protein
MLLMEDEKREHRLKMKKMEADMEQVFETKVREKKQKLKESEVDVSNLWVLVSVIMHTLSRAVG